MAFEPTPPDREPEDAHPIEELLRVINLVNVEASRGAMFGAVAINAVIALILTRDSPGDLLDQFDRLVDGQTGKLTATQRTDFTVVTTQIRNAIKLAASWDGLKQSRESGPITERRRQTDAAISRIGATEDERR